jgi:hypothetical protein
MFRDKKVVSSKFEIPPGVCSWMPTPSFLPTLLTPILVLFARQRTLIEDWCVFNVRLRTKLDFLVCAVCRNRISLTDSVSVLLIRYCMYNICS